jgi:hypothetical protein
VLTNPKLSMGFKKRKKKKKNRYLWGWVLKLVICINWIF